MRLSERGSVWEVQFFLRCQPSVGRTDRWMIVTYFRIHEFVLRLRSIVRRRAIDQKQTAAAAPSSPEPPLGTAAVCQEAITGNKVAEQAAVCSVRCSNAKEARNDGNFSAQVTSASRAATRSCTLLGARRLRRQMAMRIRTEFNPTMAQSKIKTVVVPSPVAALPNSSRKRHGGKLAYLLTELIPRWCPDSRCRTWSLADFFQTTPFRVPTLPTLIHSEKSILALI